jgi:signal transduction histidine kinase/ActR/RegA family two-component response regulator
MRMPPGWDGVETIEALWKIDPRVQVVIATAYSDHTWEDIVRRLGISDRLLILKKPFEGVEIRQLSSCLVEKWRLGRRANLRMDELEALAAEKTQALAQVNGELRSRLLETYRAQRKARAAMLAVQASNRDLEQARSAAFEASRTKSEFLTNMSHEIRTPMTAILGFTDLLQEAGLKREEMTQHVATIRRNGEHLLTLINDILDVSKIEAGAFQVDRTSCSPEAVLHAVIELMAVRAAEKGLRLVLDTTNPLPRRIQTDPMRFRQILLNLVGNAIKFTETGSIRISPRIIEALAGAGPALVVDVQDTGVGLTPEQMDRLFKPFSRVDNTSSRRQGGTGLGLSISRKLAELLGGTVSVQSRLGTGSTFSARIDTGPLEGIGRVEISKLSRSVLPADERRIGSETRVEGHVLLVDDGADNRRLVRLILTRAGATVDLAEDGYEACLHMKDALSIGPDYDLVLMDMQMPGMDGYQTTGEFRRFGFRGPIVALTAHAMAGDRERCLAAGCDEYMTKPIDRQRLLALCSTLVHRLDSVRAPLPASRPSPAERDGSASPSPESARESN